MSKVTLFVKPIVTKQHLDMLSTFHLLPLPQMTSFYIINSNFDFVPATRLLSPSLAYRLQ